MAGHLAGQPGMALAQAMRGRSAVTARSQAGTHSARPRRTPPSAVFASRQSGEGDLQVSILKASACAACPPTIVKLVSRRS
jgi:hypothetical protein